MRRSSFTSGWVASHLAATKRSAGGVGRAFLAILVWVAGCAFAANAARASCLDRFEPDIRRLDAEADRNAVQALAEIDGEIDALRGAAHPDAHRLAELYAVQAQSYSILDLDASARAAATAGMALVPAATDPVHLSLLTAYAESVDDAPELARAAATVDAARKAQTNGSLADICLSVTLGRLQYRQDRSDLAVSSLMHAYRSSAGAGLERQRVEAAWALAPVMRSMGDFTQALALNQEVVDWESARGATLALSIARYLRGEIFGSMRSYSDALDQFSASRRLSAAIGDTQGVAFADLQMCRAQVELRQLADARARCQSALATFAAARSVSMVKQDEAYLAEIDLAEGRADRARVALDRVLDNGGAERMSPRQLPYVYELRARTNAALGRYRQAFADLSEYLRRYRGANDADRATIAAAQRARFETDREIERNATLQQELARAHEWAAREREELRWIAAASGAGVLVIALLTYVLVANLRYRRELVRLAQQDSLTGLPNRRRTAELASFALAAAGSLQRPLTVALIDLDRFKTINDLGGHASGDQVLREFARVGQECVRAGDILGRWGGEEFLLVLPDTTLDTALGIVDRLRTLAAAIDLPPPCAGLRVSLSAGLAMSGVDVRTLDEIVARADAALYEAKHDGRDLVRIAEASDRAAAVRVRRALGPA